MKQYDMIQELKDIQRGIEFHSEWLKEGMGKNCLFMNEEIKRLNNIVNQLVEEYNQYTSEKFTKV